MGLRKILTDAESALHKTCKPVENFDKKLHTLLGDMRDTLIDSGGVGLAAPQVGVLRRIFVMDVGDGYIEAINPEITEQKGNQEDVEGCLSSPGEYGITRRPKRVKLKAQDRNGKWFYITGEDLKARCICHENDHLDGVLFKTHVIRMLDPEELA